MQLLYASWEEMGETDELWNPKQRTEMKYFYIEIIYTSRMFHGSFNKKKNQEFQIRTIFNPG